MSRWDSHNMHIPYYTLSGLDSNSIGDSNYQPTGITHSFHLLVERIPYSCIKKEFTCPRRKIVTLDDLLRAIENLASWKAPQQLCLHRTSLESRINQPLGLPFCRPAIATTSTEASGCVLVASSPEILTCVRKGNIMTLIKPQPIWELNKANQTIQGIYSGSPNNLELPGSRRTQVEEEQKSLTLLSWMSIAESNELDLDEGLNASMNNCVRDRLAAVRQRNRATAVGLNKIPARAPPSLPLSASPPKKTKTPEPHILAEEPSRTHPRGSTPPAPASLKRKEDSLPSTPVTKRDDPSTASDRPRRIGASGGPAENTLAVDSPAEGYSGREAFSPPPPVDEIDDYLGDPADPVEMKRKVVEMQRKHALLIQALEKGKQAADHRIDWLEMECVRLSNEVDVVTGVDQTDPLAILNDVDQHLRLARRGVAAARAFHFPRRPPCVRGRGGRWSVRDRLAAVRQRNRATGVGLNKIPARAPPSLPLSASPPKKTKTPEPHILAEEPSRTHPRGSTPPAPPLASREKKHRFLEASQRPETIRINISEFPSQRLSPQDSLPSTPVTKRDDPSTASDRPRRIGASGGPAENTLAVDSPAEGYSGREAFSPPPPVDEIDDYLGDPADPVEMKRKVVEMLRKHALLIQALEKGKQAADHRIDWLEMECVRLSNEVDVVTGVDQTDPLAILNDVDQQLRLARRGVAAARAFHFPRRPPCVRGRGGRWRERRSFWRWTTINFGLTADKVKYNVS
ncbi:hypothetical protein KSP39_PZI012645 [Platanthera zijinensis]|uniref:Uncharacterized protein n=1 Tax=Platanthera zijinensis TaxID=2320716 RepID=A0AAP0BES1_9ASPA